MYPLLPVLLLSLPLWAVAADLQNGKAVNELCATCHGEFGQGGKQGEYPRLAGLPAAYLQQQLLLFRTRDRPNLPMVEHTHQRDLPDEDIADVSAYLAAIELPSRLPPLDEARYDPYERLLLAKRTFNVAQAPGDVAQGKRLYERECRSCHGEGGRGRGGKGVPFISGQFTEYLWRQVQLLLSQQRIHDPDAPTEELLAAFSPEQIRDILAYLSVADDE